MDGIDTSQIASNVLETIRGEIAADKDTLEELYNWIVDQLNSIDTTVSWDEIENKPEFQGSADLVGVNIDWSGKPILRKTITADSALTFANLIENKTITLRITGSFSLSFPAYAKKISGIYNGGVVNLVQMLCTNATSGNEEVWYSISQEEV